MLSFSSERPTISTGSFTFRRPLSTLPVTTDGTIYSLADSKAQAYAEKYGYNFALIDGAPEVPTETNPVEQPTEPAENPTEPGEVNPNVQYKNIMPDIDGNGVLDASDASILLTFAVQSGAGTVSSFAEFMQNWEAENK